MKRISWRKLGVERLISQNTDNPVIVANAEKIWENAYRQALRRVRKAGVKDINISRELFISSFYRTDTALFKFDKGTSFDVTNRIQINDKFREDTQKEFIKARFKGMSESYEEVNEIVNAYIDDTISYEEFREKIDEFRETDEDYLKSGSR